MKEPWLVPTLHFDLDQVSLLRELANQWPRLRHTNAVVISEVICGGYAHRSRRLR